MKTIHIVCVGGGSGGHITPILPVLRELLKHRKLKIDLVVDKGFYEQTKGLIERSGLPIKLHTISSGRFRRYATFKWHDYLRRPSIPIANLVDGFRVGAGYVQSLTLLRKKPDVVFAKGGFVSLPLGLAAKTLGIPLVIHDSDARPGLTNTVLSRFAKRIGTGTPVENYPYDKSITRYTGVPISGDYRVYSKEEQRVFKQELGFDPDKPLIVATGGGLGARGINQAILKDANKLLDQSIQLYLITGKGNFEESKQQAPEHSSLKLVDFVYAQMAHVLAAADVVVSRASATTIQELAGLAKPTILIPASHLGDQVQNAKSYQSSQSAVVLRDEEIGESSHLAETIIRLVGDEARRNNLASELHRYAKPDAAKEIAELILEVID